MSDEPKITAHTNEPLAKAKLRVVELERTNRALQQLARRNYPGLNPSGLCSRHQYPTFIENYECEQCFPSWRALAESHNKLKQEAWEKIEVLESRLARYDDQRPITEGLLRGMGFKQTQRMEYEHSGMRWLGLGLRVWKCFDGLWTVTLLTDDICGGLPQETHLPNHKTIGQLAHLLDALGVSKESNS